MKIYCLVICIAGITVFSCDEDGISTPKRGTRDVLLVSNFSLPFDLENWHVQVSKYGDYDLKSGLLELETGYTEEPFGDNAHIISKDSWEIADGDTYYITVNCRVHPSDNFTATHIGAVCAEQGSHTGYNVGFRIHSSIEEKALYLAAMDCYQERFVEEFSELYSETHTFTIKLYKSAICYYCDNLIVGRIYNSVQCEFNYDFFYLHVGIGSMEGDHSIQIDKVKLEKVR